MKEPADLLKEDLDNAPAKPDRTVACSECGEIFKNGTGLASHTRAHHPSLYKKKGTSQSREAIGLTVKISDIPLLLNCFSSAIDTVDSNTLEFMQGLKDQIILGLTK